ncbi:MAG TPA: response regulator [Actinomycetes bacterium]|nr:response regulator [Actinomycetes bacterium]
MSGPVAPIRVLVVDDDFAVASVHRAYVDGLAGFTVVAEAHSAAQALRAADELRPDLVLLDIHLPDMSGLEVLQRLRARPGGQELDVIAITAAREVDTVRSAMAGGVAHYLIKPFTLQVFQERMQAYAAQRDKLRRLSARKATVSDQGEVDRLLAARLPGGGGSDLPKGLSRHTLSLVAEVLRDADGDLSAGEAAARCGLSRVSARRYLEQLTAMGLADVKPRYGTAGRPEHGYVWGGGTPPRP